MPKFTPITVTTLAEDEVLREYLKKSKISPAHKGGTFVGNYEIAPDFLREYGIVLPNGGMILPGVESFQIVSLLEQRREKEKKEERTVREEEANRRLKEEKEEAEVVKVRDELLRPFKDLCEEFSDLNLMVLDGGGGTAYIKKKKDHCKQQLILFEIDMRSSHSSSFLEEVREAFEKELSIREFREKSLKRIASLADLLDENHLSSIQILNWQGYYKTEVRLDNLEIWLHSIHKLRFRGETFEWKEEDLVNLGTLVITSVSEMKLANDKAFAQLKLIPLVGASVKAEVWCSWQPGYHGDDDPGGSLPTRIVLNGEVIPFPTFEIAQEAETWALENGAFLPHHHSVGEMWRETAKMEDWSEERCKLVVALLKGERIREERYSVQTQKMYEGKGTGRFSSMTTNGWSLAGVCPLTEKQIKFLRNFAEKAGIEFVTLTKEEETVQIQEEAIQLAHIELVFKVEILLKYKSKRGEMANIFTLSGMLPEIIEEIKKSPYWGSEYKKFSRGFRLCITLLGIKEDDGLSNHLNKSLNKREVIGHFYDNLKSLNKTLFWFYSETIFNYLVEKRGIKDRYFLNDVDFESTKAALANKS